MRLTSVRGTRAPICSSLICSIAFLVLAAPSGAGNGLTEDELKLLQDPGGWEYISLSDSDKGVQTTHTCFDGTPHPDQCSGTITFTADNTFVQNVHIHGQTVARNGKYELDGNQVALFDELGTKDGPYALELNTETKSLVLKMPQVRIELESEKEYKSNQQRQKEPRPPATTPKD